ncbi:putative leader peptide [Pseudonocardia sp. NPDC046786]
MFVGVRRRHVDLLRTASATCRARRSPDPSHPSERTSRDQHPDPA